MSNNAVQVHTSSELAEHIRAIKPHLSRLLPDPARFGTAMIAAARHNPALLECDPASVIGAALQCAQLGLEPGPAGHVFLVPFWNSKTRTKDVEIIPGWKGLKVLAERHPNVLLVDSGTIHENDHWVYTRVPAHLEHTPATGDRGDAIRWYAIAYTVEGPDIVEVLDRAQVEERRQSGNSPNSPAWTKWFDAMAQKSAVRAIWPRLPSSLDMERANQLGDGTVVTPEQFGVSSSRPAVGDGHDPDDRGEVEVELVDENGEPMVRGRAPATDVDGLTSADNDVPDGQEVDDDPGSGKPATSGDDKVASPDTPLTDGGADDRQILAIITLQKQRGLDDHDLAELIRDQTDHEADDLDGMLDLLDADQAADLITHLNGRTDADGGGK